MTRLYEHAAARPRLGVDIQQENRHVPANIFGRELRKQLFKCRFMTSLTAYIV